ncbi:hypothetical protein [Niveibacterium umoris]|nr:hypothetical protein [Niveibacterium umoris]
MDNEADKRFGAFFIAAGVSPTWSHEVMASMETKKWRRKFW